MIDILDLQEFEPENETEAADDGFLTMDASNISLLLCAM